MDRDCREFPAMAAHWNNGPNCPSQNPFFNSDHHFDSSTNNDAFFLRNLIGKFDDDPSLKIHFPMADQINPNPRTLPPPATTTLPSISADPDFIERAAKFSCFGTRSFNARSKSSNPPPLPSIPRVSSTPVLKPDPKMEPDRKPGKMTGSGSNSNDESSVSEQVPSSQVSRKRKAISRPKPKEEGSPIPTKADNEDDKGSDPKRSKSNNTETEKKAAEAPKDYIHVRARRGQATDSHSLAERVRREKISERMKLLQDLVPGCNKVTGKALMLDEIINYVQSLQRQVEFLSMKLASVNPALEFNMDTLLLSTSNSKDVVNVNMYETGIGLCQQMYTTGAQQQQEEVQQLYHHHTTSLLSRGPLMVDDPSPSPSPLHLLSTAFTENFPLDFPGFNEDDLSSIVQMGFANFPVPNTMKIER